MQPLALTLIGVIAAGTVAFVAWPLLRAPHETRSPARGGDPTELGLLEQRDRALAALNELEFDHRTGKVSTDDYRALLVALRLEAAQALRQLPESADRGSAAQPASGAEQPTSRRAVPKAATE